MPKFALLLSIFGLLGVGLAIGVAIGMQSDQVRTSGFVAQLSAPLRNSVSPQPSSSPLPIPTPSPQLPEPKSTEWTSPNGKSILVLKVTPTAPSESMYSFSVKTATDPNEHLVFSKTLEAPATLSIPFNSWSPDNKHFFVQENTGTEIKSYVFKSTGEPFADAQPLLDVDTLFAAKNLGFALKEVTGWAAPTLLIVNSVTADNSNGPSYWFDVNRKSVTRLSTSFQ